MENFLVVEANEIIHFCTKPKVGLIYMAVDLFRMVTFLRTFVP